MSKFVYALCAVMILLALPTTGEAKFACARKKEGCGAPYLSPFVKGDSVVIPKNYSGSGWTVHNPTGIYNSKKRFASGSKCQLRAADTLKVIATDDKYLLIRYEISKRSDDVSDCPTGTLFLVKPIELEQLFGSPRYEFKR